MRFLGVAGQGDFAEMQEFVDAYELGAFEHIADPGGGIWRAFEITGQPSFIFIDGDGDGEIRRHIGTLTVDDLTTQLDLLDP